MNIRALCPGVKRPGSEADHTLPGRADVKSGVQQQLHSPLNVFLTFNFLPFVRVRSVAKKAPIIVVLSVRKYQRGS
jgi:hypothetical protein